MTTVAAAVASTGTLLVAITTMTTTTTPCSFTRAPPAGRHALEPIHPGPPTTARLTAASGNPAAGRCPTCGQEDGRGHRRRASTLGRGDLGATTQPTLLCLPSTSPPGPLLPSPPPPAPTPAVCFCGGTLPLKAWPLFAPCRGARRLLCRSCPCKESVNQENPRDPLRTLSTSPPSRGAGHTDPGQPPADGVPGAAPWPQQTTRGGPTLPPPA